MTPHVHHHCLAGEVGQRHLPTRQRLSGQVRRRHPRVDRDDCDAVVALHEAALRPFGGDPARAAGNQHPRGR